MRKDLCALVVLGTTFALLGVVANSRSPEAIAQTGLRLYLPAALANDSWPQVTTVLPTTDQPATSTPPPTPALGTAETPPPTSTPGAIPPATVLAVGRVSDPDVAGDGTRSSCQHLVVWLDTDMADGAIWGRFIESDRLGEPFLISSDLGAAGPPEVAYSPALEKWLVVWPAPHLASVSMLRGRMVACPAPEGPVIEIGHYFLIEDQPAVAADGDGFAVVWRRSFSGRPDYQLVGVRVTGPAVPEPQLLGEPGPAGALAAGFKLLADCSRVSSPICAIVVW